VTYYLNGPLSKWNAKGLTRLTRLNALDVIKTTAWAHFLSNSRLGEAQLYNLLWNTKKNSNSSSCQFHQRFLRAFFVQNFGDKNYEAGFWVWNFGAKNFVRKMRTKNVDEIDTRIRFLEAYFMVLLDICLWDIKV